MPIMTKANPPEPKIEYEIMDPFCHEIAGLFIATGQKTIWLHERVAQFYVANGSLLPMRSAPEVVAAPAIHV